MRSPEEELGEREGKEGGARTKRKRRSQEKEGDEEPGRGREGGARKKN